MPTEDKFKDLFNNPSLENEDWLEPGPGLLGAITDEIYPEENRRKKFIFILFFTGAILALLLLLLYNISQNNQGQSSDIGLNETSLESNINNVKSKEISSTISRNNESDISQISNNKQDVKSITSSSKKNNNNPRVVVDTKAASPALNRAIVNTSLPTKRPVYASANFTPVAKNTTVNNNANTAIFSAQKKNLKNQFVPVENSVLQTSLSLIPFSKRLEINTLHNNRRRTSISSDNIEDSMIDIAQKNKDLWVFEIGAGVSTARFILNDNYSSDLDPFEFTHESAKGYHINLAASKPISRKLNLKLVSSYEKLNMNSGHNSDFIYSLDEETNATTNTREMGMATPLGFISSEIVVERVANDVSSETSLVIDLQNKHTLQLIELSGVGEYNLVSTDKIKLQPSVGFGASYLINISNDLRSFTPSNSDFTSSNSKITANQSNINKLTPFLDLGIGLSYYIKPGISAGGTFRFKKNLQPVYEQDDYNSSMNRQNIGLFLKFDF